MVSRRAHVLTVACLTADLATTTAALLAAALAVQPEGDGRPSWPAGRTAAALGLVLPIWILVFSALRLYGRHVLRPVRSELARIAAGVALGTALLALLDRSLGFGPLPSQPAFLATFVLLNIGATTAGRMLARPLVRDALGQRRVLVAGDRDEALRVAADVEASRRWGLELVGLVSDGTWADAPGRRLLGAIDDLPRLLGEHVVDEVIFAPGDRQPEQIRTLEPLFLQLEEQGIATRVLVNFLPQAFSAVSLDRLGGRALLMLATAPRDDVRLLVRRVIEAAAAFALLVLVSPLLLLIALAIKLTSPGPVLFRQTRCGLHGRPFAFFKFRSMRAGAEALKPGLAPFNEMDGPVFKMTHDPRVTPLGAFLRRTSLDELPQLWNILKGDMSFVGPRPAVPNEVAQYEPWQRRRLSMKPGLTGLWQISGRSDLTFDGWIHLDLEYIDNWSLWMDLKIVLKTIPAVLRGRGAR